MIHLILFICTLAVFTPSQAARPVIVEMKVLPGMQYSVPRFAAKPGQRVEIRFTNDDEMAHNLLVVKSGRREAIVVAALALGADGPTKGYVPDSGDVLWSIPVINPGESRKLHFSAPKTAGIYPYVCTYPGHGMLMFGAMYVGKKMPKLTEDKHVSPLVRSGTQLGHRQHGFHAWRHDRRPIMYRIFMPDATPAAIAVGLSGEQSYCYDAGVCRMRYAWRGGFVDPWPVWKANGNGLAKLQGVKFYTEKRFPLRVGDGVQPEPEFLGYSLVDRRPEFHYRIGAVEVRELITVEDGSLMRRFRFSGADRAITFAPEWDGDVAIVTTPRAWQNGCVTVRTSEVLTVRITQEGGR